MIFLINCITFFFFTHLTAENIAPPTKEIVLNLNIVNENTAKVNHTTNTANQFSFASIGKAADEYIKSLENKVETLNKKIEIHEKNSLKNLLLSKKIIFSSIAGMYLIINALIYYYHVYHLENKNAWMNWNTIVPTHKLNIHDEMFMQQFIERIQINAVRSSSLTKTILQKCLQELDQELIAVQRFIALYSFLQTYKLSYFFIATCPLSTLQEKEARLSILIDLCCLSIVKAQMT